MNPAGRRFSLEMSATLSQVLHRECPHEERSLDPRRTGLAGNDAVNTAFQYPIRVRIISRHIIRIEQCQSDFPLTATGWRIHPILRYDFSLMQDVICSASSGTEGDSGDTPESKTILSRTHAKGAARPRRVPWVLLRRISQTLAFTVFFAILLLLTWPLALPFDPRIIFQLDPLTHLWLIITRQPLQSVGWAVAALVFWAVFGRIFCGWVCPLGTMLDFSRWFTKWFQRIFRLYPKALQSSGSSVRGKRNGMTGTHSGRMDSSALKLPGSLNLWLLGVMLTLAAFKMPLIWVFDPIVLSFKFITVALWPAVDRPVRAAYTALDGRFYAEDFWYGVSRFFNRFILPYREPTYVDALLIVLFVLTLFILENHHRRWWCKYICPLGAMLRISYFVSPIKRRILDGCSACTLCEAECHFSGDDIHDCFYCMECIERCPTGKLTFLPGGKLARFDQSETGELSESKKEDTTRNGMREKIQGINASKLKINRRAFLGSIAAGVVVYPFLEVFNQKIRLPIDFIRPPGALGEQEFLERCIKCGQCLKVCLTNGLQPALFEAGLDGLWTPRLISRMGYCEYECNLCGKVCPTGAIQSLPLEDKKEAVIGTAYLNTDRCIPFVTDKPCIVCEEHCPIEDKAIKLYDVEAVREDGTRYIISRPKVIQERCTGCGICEFVCPLEGEAAIRIFRTAPKLEGGTGGYGDYPGYGETGADYPDSDETSGDYLESDG